MMPERLKDWMMLGLLPIVGLALAFWLLLQGHGLMGWGVASLALCMVLYYVAHSGGRVLRRREIAARVPACLFSPPLIVLVFGGNGNGERALALAACLVIILLPLIEQQLYRPSE